MRFAHRTKRFSPSAKGFARVRNDHHSELAEDYVELIDELIQEKGEARAVDMAKRIGVSHVTVSKTIGRLKEVGLVTCEPYRSVFLTMEGRAMAEKSRQRHRTVMNFLMTLGISEDMAAVDAEGIEHHVSETTLQAMDRFNRR